VRFVEILGPTYRREFWPHLRGQLSLSGSSTPRLHSAWKAMHQSELDLHLVEPMQQICRLP